MIYLHDLLAPGFVNAPTAREGGEDGEKPDQIGLTPYPLLCRPCRAKSSVADLPFY